MTENRKIFLNALNCIAGTGYLTLEKINDYFRGDFEAAFKAAESRFKQAGISSPELEAILTKRGGINPEKEYEKLAKEKINFISFDEEEYPKILKEIKGAPL